ncbi:Rha family transcriptional regulator [Spirosoma sp. 48-14]|nr:Rha family transcriptional regulator [Spirosoma sp. 48-14]
MTSLEIAELTGKQHKNVLRDIRSMVAAFKKAKSDGSNLSWHCESDSYSDSQGKKRQLYRLDKATTITLLSGYDVVARHRIVKRWEQLEKEKAQAEVGASNPIDQLSVFTERPKQIQNSKEVNSYNFSQGGKEQAIDYNRKNCFLHTGKTPSELMEWAKSKKIPSKFRTSAKEIIRTYRPAVSSSMALADEFCKTGKINIDESATFCKNHALPVFQKMQDMGLLKTPDVPKLISKS